MEIDYSPQHFLAQVERDRQYLETIIATMGIRDGSAGDVLKSTIIRVLLSVWMDAELRN